MELHQLDQQIGAAANHYVINVVKAKKVAVVSDTTGYGTASLDAYTPMLKKIGLSSRRARSSASGPHGYQSTGLFACWRR